ncbi:hypothetical protein DOTSEDRAFT_74026 [Dothistroma septosporum NZE10]|uniref:Uncharacterized protein n=1 Tax=Dothistroma septosporum (strain NZE10 / CBS 128990) TaxID=675120 RepID=N1PJU9_DOTSN|nr:hypothetical protein DOTSEDRAFT_74026 [Dothistroma septosporum NZE10]
MWLPGRGCYIHEAARTKLPRLPRFTRASRPSTRCNGCSATRRVQRSPGQACAITMSSWVCKAGPQPLTTCEEHRMA